MASMTLMVQEAPMVRLAVLDMLLKMASRRGKREHALAIDTLKDLVNKKFFQTDHLLASVCDDPENFFVMFRTLNNGFDFQTKSNFKKLYTGPAWHAAIHFVRKALIMHRRYYSAQ